jgi:outer membrane protein
MSSRKNTLLLWLIIGLFAPFSLWAQSIHQFTAKESADYAAKNNAQVKNALLDLKIQEQSNRVTTSAALPNLSGTASFTDNLQIATQLIPGEFAGAPAGTFIPLKFGTKYIGSGSLQLTQLLFDGQVFIGLKARQTSMDFRQKNFEVTEESIRTNIYKIYYQLVVSKTQIELLDSNISRLSKLRRDTKIMYDNGFSEMIDVDKVDVQLVNLETEKIKALNSIDAGYFGLKTLMGMPLTDSLVLVESITDDNIKSGVLDTTYNYADRKDFQLLESNKRLNEFNVRRYKLSYLPTLNFTLSYSQQAQREKFDFLKSGQPWFPATYYNLRLNVPIFSGFSKDAQVKQAKLELQQVENNINNLKLSIDNDAQKAKLTFNSAIKTLDYQKKNMQLAEKVYGQTKTKYEIGTGSNTEINNAQTDLKTAQTNYINAMYDAIIARIDYLKATGKLN